MIICLHIFCCRFSDIQRDTYREHGTSQPHLLPRNLKQVQNMQQKIARSQEKHDDFYEVCLMSKQHPDIILTVQFASAVLIIQVHPEIVRHVSTFRKVFKGKPIVYHYDTTFDMGGFYVSILSVRHPLFKGEPIIPVAMMIHERLETKSQPLMFNFQTHLTV